MERVAGGVDADDRPPGGQVGPQAVDARFPGAVVGDGSGESAPGVDDEQVGGIGVGQGSERPRPGTEHGGVEAGFIEGVRNACDVAGRS